LDALWSDRTRRSKLSGIAFRSHRTHRTDFSGIALGSHRTHGTRRTGRSLAVQSAAVTIRVEILFRVAESVDVRVPAQAVHGRPGATEDNVLPDRESQQLQRIAGDHVAAAIHIATDVGIHGSTRLHSKQRDTHRRQ